MEKQVEIGSKYTVEVSGSSFGVEVNPPSLKEMIDQLLINAENHGFKEKNDSNFKVKFHLIKVKTQELCIIEYSNNGSDFALSLDQFTQPFRKGQRSNGTGIGGNYIKRIVEAHKGIIDLNRKIRHGFGLKIELPLSQQNEDDQ